jgi:hypothetical protein
MKEIILSLLLPVLVGCAPIGGSGHERPVDPKPVSGDAIEEAARQYLHDYATNLADSAGRLAGRSSEFSTWESAFGEWKMATKAARESASKQLDYVVNREMSGKFEAWDSAEFAKLMRAQAAGFRGAAK